MYEKHWSAKKHFFAPCDSYSSDIAESEYDSQITSSPTNFKGGGIKLEKYVFNKKVICWF
jgi:hypothetical protein